MSSKLWGFNLSYLETIPLWDIELLRNTGKMRRECMSSNHKSDSTGFQNILNPYFRRAGVLLVGCSVYLH